MLYHIAGVGHQIKSAFNYVVHYEAYLIDCKLRELQEDKTELRAKAKLAADRQEPSNDEKKLMASKQDVYKELHKIPSRLVASG